MSGSRDDLDGRWSKREGISVRRRAHGQRLRGRQVIGSEGGVDTVQLAIIVPILGWILAQLAFFGRDTDRGSGEETRSAARLVAVIVSQQQQLDVCDAQLP